MLLGFLLGREEDNVFGFGRVKKLQTEVQALSVQVGRLRDAVDRLTNFLGRAIFPIEAMGELTGELRAIRQLMDTEGRYRFIDRERELRKAGKSLLEDAPPPAPTS